HSDDQAETVVQRLLRGSGYAGLVGMSKMASVRGVAIVRPLLGVRRTELAALLRERGIEWREDASNRSPGQQRNRVRRMLEKRTGIAAAALELSRASREWRGWVKGVTPVLGESFAVRELARLARPIAI